MHCRADLPDEASGSSTPDEILGDDEFGSLSDDFSRDNLGSTVGNSWNSLTSRDRHKLDGFAGRLVSMLVTDVPEPEGVPRDTFTAPLWMRLPIAFVSGIFVFIAVGFASLFLFDDWLGPLGGTVTLAVFAGIVWWLVRKPLASDIVADACYAIALSLLALPSAFVLNGVVSGAFGAGDPLGEIIVGAVIMQIFLLFPAGVLLIVGYVGNRYARSKLDTLAESATDPTNG
jgi:hypothetical protein